MNYNRLCYLKLLLKLTENKRITNEYSNYAVDVCYINAISSDELNQELIYDDSEYIRFEIENTEALIKEAIISYATVASTTKVCYNLNTNDTVYIKKLTNRLHTHYRTINSK